MKLLKYAVAIVLVMPMFALAQTVPAFPMAFWGNVAINGSPAPVGTVVNAYYGSTLAGRVTVQNAGVYGYTDPTAQKLVIGEGTGTISFTVQSPQFNSGAETGGTSQPTYAGFTSGSTVENDIAFTIPVPSSGSISGSPSSGGGGGGGISYSYGLVINGGATTTTSTAVTLSITPAGDANQMWISNTSAFSSGPWMPFQSTYPWMLASTTGVQTVYVRYGSASTTIATAQTSIELVAAANTISAPTTIATTSENNSRGEVLGASTYNFARSLSTGSSGPDVAQLQTILIADGFLKINAPTGYFGPMTKSAVKLFQSAHGITPDSGYVGPITRAVLNQGTSADQTASTTSAALTASQRAALLQQLEAELQVILAKIAALEAATQTH